MSIELIGLLLERRVELLESYYAREEDEAEVARQGKRGGGMVVKTTDQLLVEKIKRQSKKKSKAKKASGSDTKSNAVKQVSGHYHMFIVIKKETFLCYFYY